MTRWKQEEQEISLTDLNMEIGVTGLKESGGVIHEEFLRQLMGERGLDAFREMSSNDSTVGAMLYAMEMILRSVPLEVEPFSDEPEDEEAAEFLDTIFGDMSHSYHQFMSEWMATPTYGFGPFEVVYKLRQGLKIGQPGASSQYDDGKVGVRKLAIRHPDTLVRWIFDDEGGVQAMEQRTDRGTVTIPIQKMLLFTVLSRKGNPEGMSLLRRAYIAYYRKKRIEEIEAIGIERDLSGLPHFTVPPEWMLATPGTEEAALLEAVKKIGQRLKNDEQACVISPAIFDKDGNSLFGFELVSSGGRRSFDTQAIKQGYAAQILMTTMADVILLGHENVGSFALATSKADLWATGLSALLDSRDDVLNRHLVPRLMNLNGFPMDRLPKFKHGDIESVNLEELGNYIQSLASAGHVMFPSETGELEREVHRMAGLPQPAFGEVGDAVGSEPPPREQIRPDVPSFMFPGDLDDGA